jgi:hypothetical protein
MFSASELLTALVLLMAPVGTPETTPSEEDWPRVRDAIHHKAIELELMDPRETRYILALREDFQNDLDILRRRHDELKDAPPLCDFNRLVARDVVHEIIKENRASKKLLEDQLVWAFDRVDLISPMIKELDRQYRYWDAVRDANCPFYHVPVRRAALLRVRDFEQNKIAAMKPAQK